MTGKNMNYYLMDGTPKGRIKCTLANWTGVTYRIPRVQLVNCREIEYLKQSGVYFLFCRGEDDRPMVYVGQARMRRNGLGILNRLKEHHASPRAGFEDWYEAVAFTTTNNTFGATEVSWLENHFYALAKSANRYDATNGNEPSAGNVTEEKESELREYADYAKIVMGVLGHLVFEPLSAVGTEPAGPQSASEIDYRIKRRDVDAHGRRVSDGFVVLKGSKIKIDTQVSCPFNAWHQRTRNASHIGADGVLSEDILLHSANEAACFVVGTSINGIQAWKTPDGRTLKEVEASEAGAL